MAIATPISLTGIHPSKDPGMVKSKRSITSRFTSDIVGETGFEDVELTELFSFSLTSIESSRVLGVSGLERRSKTLLVIAMQIA
jgi:hypothetical protein